MTNEPLTSHPPDICLILRAHAEQLWLTARVLPTLRQLEQPGEVGEESVGAALAYLEVLWLDACQRAADTDAAFADLLRYGAARDRVLYERARRYHTAVRRLRTAVGCRVGALTGAGGHEPARWPICDRYAGS
jgi:hypothetical protein